MSERIKTKAEKTLDDYVDRLKNDGVAVVYCLARYDGLGARFSTRISVPEGRYVDRIVHALVSNFDEAYSLSVFDRIMLKDLNKEGWANVVMTYGRAGVDYDHEDIYMGWSISGDDTPNPDTDDRPLHGELDIFREVLVSWSNMMHKAQLVWKD